MNLKKGSSAKRKGKGSSAVIAAFVVAMMVAASAPLLFVGGHDNDDADGAVFGTGPAIDITDKTVSEIRDEIRVATDGASAADSINVIGAISDADETLHLFIPTGVTMIWDATYEGDVSGILICINFEGEYGRYAGNFASNFSGTFRLTDKGMIRNTSDDAIALSMDSGNVITAGVIEAGRQWEEYIPFTGKDGVGIHVEKGNVTVTGGTITAFWTGSVGIRVGEGNVTVTGGRVDSGANVPGAHDDQGEYGVGIEVGKGDVTMTDGGINARWSRGIGISVSEGNVTMTGGAIFMDQYGTGIHAEKGNVTMADGKIFTWNPGVTGVRVVEGILNMAGGEINTYGNHSTNVSVGSDTTEGYAVIRGGEIIIGHAGTMIHVVNGAAVYLDGIFDYLENGTPRAVHRADDGFIVCADHYYADDNMLSGNWFREESNTGAAVTYDRDGEPPFFTNGDQYIQWGTLEAGLESIAVTVRPDRTVYYMDELLNLTGLMITATYDGGNSIPVTGYTTDPANWTKLGAVGTQTVRVSYTVEGVKKTTDFDVTVKPVPVLEGIFVETSPENTVYTAGEPLDLTGIIIVAIYDDGSSAVTNFTTDPADGEALTADTVRVTVSLTVNGVTRTTTFDVTVNPATLTDITVTAQPAKATYLVGETLNLAGLVITATYSDNSTAAVTGYNTSQADGSALDTAGTITVTVSYTEGSEIRTASFTVTVSVADKEDEPWLDGATAIVLVAVVLFAVIFAAVYFMVIRKP
ncbi:MAG: bacterial Ig-like domain-containing protein [Methanomassiliicoccaceae archaeon]|jgi:hypothetical protein|nr:bacterial Ig-like domain-containing protein [Methanomassiliicoccaceae archaeon]